MAVLVTGGAGYIGSHVCKALKQAGFFPITIDNLSKGHTWAVKFGPLVQQEISDQEKLKEVIAEFKPVATIHLASSINVRESIQDPLFYYENNVAATLALLETLVEQKMNVFVFSSSAAVYGQPHILPITEEHEKMPLHPYGKSKLMVEQVLEDLNFSHGFLSASLRYFNAAGADPENELGEAHDPETHLIPLALGAALETTPALTIYGNDFPTHDGTAIRDYIHVADLADAHVKALVHLLEKKESLTLNLGTGNGHSVKEIIDGVQRYTGLKVPHQYAPRNPADPTALVADPSKAKKVLKWTPRFSSLQTIIETAYAWQCKNSCSTRA